MKYETLILQALFVVCLLVCVLTFGTMLAYQPSVATIAACPLVSLVGSIA